MARYDFSTTRLYVADDLTEGGDIAVSADQAHFLLHVLRLERDAPLLVFNGRDGEWRATIAQTQKRSLRLRVDSCLRAQEAGPDIDYCFAPLKHARLDYVVQKAVEMGAAKLQPVMTRHTQISRLNLERMRANAVEAAEQCGVLRLPIVEKERSLERLIAEWAADRILVFCDENAGVADPVLALKNMEGSANQKVGVLVGPEGGFDSRERELVCSLPRVVRLSLGPRILRADTAAVAALALVQSALGDWR